MLWYAMLGYLYSMPFYAVLCYSMLCYANCMLCHCMLCYAMPRYACYTTLCYAMLCFAVRCDAIARRRVKSACLDYRVGVRGLAATKLFSAALPFALDNFDVRTRVMGPFPLPRVRRTAPSRSRSPASVRTVRRRRRGVCCCCCCCCRFSLDTQSESEMQSY